MRKKVITALLLSAIMLANVVTVAAQTIPQSGTTTIVPNRLTVTWEDESRDDVTIDTFRFFGFNVAQLRTMVNVLDGSVANLADGTFQINQEGAPVGFQPIVFRQATEINYIINTTPIRNHEGARVFPSQPGWVFLPEHEYNWASVRDVINSMGLDLIDVVDDPAAGHTQVTVRRPGPPERPPSGPAVPPPGTGRWRDGWWRDQRDPVRPIGRDVEDVISRARNLHTRVTETALIPGITTGNALGLEADINAAQTNINTLRDRINTALDRGEITYAEFRALRFGLDEEAQPALNAARNRLALEVNALVRNDILIPLPTAAYTTPNALNVAAAIETAVTNAQDWVNNANRIAEGANQANRDAAYALRQDLAVAILARANDALAYLALEELEDPATIRAFATHVDSLITRAQTAINALEVGPERSHLNHLLYEVRRDLQLFRLGRPLIFTS
jgi:hypothetical protein